MKFKYILFVVVFILSCKTKKLPVAPLPNALKGKIIDTQNNEIALAEIIIKDYHFYSQTDSNGNFSITSKDIINSFFNKIDILLEIRKQGYNRRKIKLNKINYLQNKNYLKFITLEKEKLPIESKPVRETQKIINKKPSIIEKKPKNRKDIYTDINVNEVNNKEGSVHIGPVNNDNRTIYNEGNKTTVINETKIIKDTKIVKVPFKERDCAKKEVGYLLIKNSYNEGINVNLITYGPQKGPMAMRFEGYTISKNSQKFFRLQSDYYYGLKGEKFSAKWAGTFVYGFSDGFYINPCDTTIIVTP